MKPLVLSITLVLSISFWGCSIASSRIYEPLDWERPLLTEAEKCIMPSDLRSRPEAYYGKRLHWVGIIDTVIMTPQDGEIQTSILIDQKYYDYIEDFGP